MRCGVGKIARESENPGSVFLQVPVLLSDCKASTNAAHKVPPSAQRLLAAGLGESYLQRKTELPV